MKTLILFAFLALVALTSCTKDDDDMPPTADQVIEWMLKGGVKIEPKNPATPQPKISTLEVYCMSIEDVNNGFYQVYVNVDYLLVISDAEFKELIVERILTNNLYNIRPEDCY